MAARMDPLHASARHQALHHFVAKADWSDAELLRRVAQWVVPKMDFSQGGWWIVDDTGFPKKGRHSVGGLGNIAASWASRTTAWWLVSISLANDRGRLPVAWQLYLPEEWAVDAKRRAKAGVPESIECATKMQIALSQLRVLLGEGAPRYPVLADAGYGVDYAFRQALTDMGLLYVVGVTSVVSVWPPGVVPLPPRRYSGMGRPPVMPRRTRTRQPLSVKALALSLSPKAFQIVRWRDGTNQALSNRFTAVRVRHAGGNAGRARLHPEQWLLIEWPADEAEPTKYYLSTLPKKATLDELVRVAHQRRRIERDYQDLKQNCGLDQYEGRGWRGFHHHATLSIAAYGFLMAERLPAEQSGSSKKTSSHKCLPFPKITSHAAVLRAQRHVPTSITSLRHSLSYHLLARMGLCP